MNKHIKGCLLFLLLIILVINTANATDVTNDTSAIEDDTISSSTEQITNEVTSIQNEEKLIKKTDNNKNYKTSQLTDSNSKTIIINSTTFDEYVTDGYLNDNVNEGDTLDFQGLLYDTRFSLYINKSVNIISSTNDAFFGSSGEKKYDGNDKESYFKILSGGSGTNLTNIHFYNTHVVTSHAHNVNIKNITVEANAIVGSGEGVTSIRDESSNITVSDSYFFSDNNGGISTLVCAGAENVIIENCTVRARLFVGNLLYFTTYNIAENMTNKNITVKNVLIDGSEAIAQSICVPLVLQGSNHKIINNTILCNKSQEFTVMAQMVLDENAEMISENLFINNTVMGNVSLANTRITGNTLDSLFSRNSTVINNTINKAFIRSNNIFVNNNVTHMIVSETNNTVTDNNCINITFNETATNYTMENNTIWDLINKDNVNEYLNSDNTLSLDSINNSMICIDLNDCNITTLTLDNIHNKTLKIKQSTLCLIKTKDSELTIINSDLSKVIFTIQEGSNVLLKDTALLDLYVDESSNLILDNSYIISGQDNIQVLSSKNNVDSNVKDYSDYFDENTHKLLSSIPENTTIIIRNVNGQNDTKPMIIDKRINIIGLNNDRYDGEITFIEGSEGSVIKNMIINNTIFVNTSNITIIDNTINKNIMLQNSENNIIKDNIIDSTVIPITLSNTQKTSIENNIIQTTDSYTINCDETSKTNTIIKNDLITVNATASNTINANMVENDIGDNGPKEESNITISIDNNLVLNKPYDIVVTVTSNNMPVTNGYVIVLSNGIQKIKSQLTNGELNTTIILDELGENNIRVFYFPEDSYLPTNEKKVTNTFLIKSIINVTVPEVKIGETTTITVLVTDEYGNNIPEGYLDFSLSDINTSMEIEDGISTINIGVREEYIGKLITVYYDGTPSIENNTYKSIFNPEKGDVDLIIKDEIQEDNTKITVTVANKLGQIITSGYIQFKGPGISKLVKIESNETCLTIPTPTEETTINITFRNNPNYEITTGSITLYSQKGSVITCDQITDVNVGDEVTITGKLTDTDNDPITDANIKVQINENEYQTTTDEEGKYQLSFTVIQSGINNVLVIFEETQRYISSQTNITFNANKKATTFLYYNFNNVNIGESVKISAKLLSDNIPVKGQNIKIIINDEEFMVKTSSTGYFVLNYITTTAGINNITFVYDGNEEYYASTNETSFKVIGDKKVTSFLYYNIKDVNVGESVKISAKLLSDNQPVNGQTVTVTVNDDMFVVKTSSTGYFALNYVTTIAGMNNITFNYEGNEDYKEVTNISSFNVVGNKKDVSFIYYNIKDVNVGDTVKISAKLLCEGQPVKSQKVTVKVNNEDIIVKTSSTGYFAFDYVTNTAGVNNLSFVYEGNAEYNAVTNTSQFNVVGDKKNVSFLYYGIKDVNVGDTVKISAKLLSEGQPVKGQNVIVTVNGEDFTAKTSSTGYLVLEYVTTASGVNNITFTYAGSGEYNAVTNTTSFNVIGSKSSTTFLFYNIKDVKLGETVKISAKLLSDGLPVKGQSVIVTVNDEEFTVKTSTTGYFLLDYNPVTTGINNITFTYGGNSEYEAVTNTTQFKCIS